MKKTLFFSLFISFNMFGQSVLLTPSAINKQNSALDDIRIQNYSNYPSIFGLRANGNVASPTALSNGNPFFLLSAGGYNGFFFSGPKASITFNATQNWTETANGTSITFGTTFNNSTFNGQRMIINHDGRVGIGTSVPTAQLDVIRGAAPDGTAIFRGTTHVSHFNYATDEHTYIRGGKNGSKVIINDVAGLGGVGIGHSNPNELLDVNGRMRIRHNGVTSGLWLSNSTNSLSIADGAFFGMEADNRVGIYIDNAWRFGVNSSGEISTTSMAGPGYRMVLASPNGVLLSNFQPQVWSISAAAFTPTTTGSAQFFKSTTSAYFSSGSSIMVAPVNLPTGVNVTEIVVFYSNSDPANTLSVRLDALVLANSNILSVSTPIIASGSLGMVTGIQSANLTIVSGQNLIDNTNRAYNLRVSSNVWSNNMAIYGVKITYSY